MDILTKLGFSKVTMDGSNMERTFDEVTDPNVKKELLLIQSAQLYNDYFAEEELIALFRGLVNNLVNSSAAKNAVGYDFCYQNAVSSLKTAIRNYDLGTYKNNKPSTYFTNYINRNLDKMHKTQTQGFAHISDALTGFRRNIYNAKEILKSSNGTEPSVEEVYNFVKNDLGITGKTFTLKEVNKLMNQYNVSELSGSREIDGADGSEAMTLEDIQTNDDTPLALMEKQKKEQNILESISIFTKDTNKQNFLQEYLGIGKYKNILNRETNLTNLAQKNGISYHTAGKLLDGFKQHCINRGLLQ